MVPADETNEVVRADFPRALELLKEMNDNAVQVAQLVDEMLDRVKKGELSTAKGLSFLEVKYHMLLSYLINLTYVVLRKCTGEPIQDDPAIDRLVELRTVLEKIRPIDSKLRYQVDKLVKAAVTGSVSENDPTHFKPNPKNMGRLNEESSDEEEEDEEEEKKGSKPKVYMPPKLYSVPYDGDTMEREQRQIERAKLHTLSSSMIQELKEEYLDSPVEISHAMEGPGRRATSSKLQKQRQEYEESYFTRLPEHKGKVKKTKLADELTSFGDLSALEGKRPSGEASSAPKTSRKRKISTIKMRKGLKKKRIA